jgi:hypothetical protein
MGRIDRIDIQWDGFFSGAGPEGDSDQTDEEKVCRDAHWSLN